MKIPFVKAHGARNDFLLTWAHEAPPAARLAEAALVLCDRHSGVGADGWLLVQPPSANKPAAIRLFNPDGGEVEISGNGTRCAAAFLVDSDLAGFEIRIQTGAGLKELRLLGRDGLRFLFEMNMNAPQLLSLDGGPDGGTTLYVGNPQCAVFVESFDFDWARRGAEIERDPMFPQRTNVSFVKVVDEHTLDVRFFERGAGVTESSGTGSTGAVAAAILRGLAKSPLTVRTVAGPLAFRWETEDIYMQGPAEIVAGGEFYFG
jgi:diaminopimelate epimerase